MTEHQVSTANQSGIVLWDAGQVRKDAFDAAFLSRGLSSLLPRKEKRSMALRKALVEWLESKTPNKGRQSKYDLNPLNSRVLGFEAVLQSKGDEKNLHAYQFTAKVRPDDTVVATADGITLGYVMDQELTVSYQNQLNFYSASTVGSLLVKAVLHWVGTPIKQRGSAYFLPYTFVDEYRSLAKELEASPDSELVMHLVYTVIGNDDYTARTVLSGFKNHTTALIDEMNADLLGGTAMTKPGYENRVAFLTEQLKRVQEYQSLFGANLNDLTTAIEALKTSLQMARLNQMSV